MFKFVAVLALVAVVVADIHEVLQHQQNYHNGHEYEHDSEPHYEFGYSVQDKHTGDYKSQHEERKGHDVKGHYSLVEPDGHKRTVEYQSDKKNGFNAVVHREGTVHHYATKDHHGHHHEAVGHSTVYEHSHHEADSHHHHH